MRSGRDLIDASPKKNHEVQVELITPKQTKKQVESKETNKIGKSKYPNGEPVEEPQNKPPPPFPQKRRKDKKDAYFQKFFAIFRELHINLPLLDVL